MISRVLRAEEFYEEGLRPRQQSDDIIAAIPVGEAMEAVRYVLDASRARTIDLGGATPS
jgi:hypothetical protein